MAVAAMIASAIGKSLPFRRIAPAWWAISSEGGTNRIPASLALSILRRTVSSPTLWVIKDTSSVIVIVDENIPEPGKRPASTTLLVHEGISLPKWEK